MINVFAREEVRETAYRDEDGERFIATFFQVVIEMSNGRRFDDRSYGGGTFAIVDDGIPAFLDDRAAAKRDAERRVSVLRQRIDQLGVAAEDAIVNSTKLEEISPAYGSDYHAEIGDYRAGFFDDDDVAAAQERGLALT